MSNIADNKSSIQKQDFFIGQTVNALLWNITVHCDETNASTNVNPSWSYFHFSVWTQIANQLNDIKSAEGCFFHGRLPPELPSAAVVETGPWLTCKTRDWRHRMNAFLYAAPLKDAAKAGGCACAPDSRRGRSVARRRDCCHSRVAADAGSQRNMSSKYSSNSSSLDKHNHRGVGSCRARCWHRRLNALWGSPLTKIGNVNAFWVCFICILFEFCAEFPNQ